MRDIMKPTKINLAAFGTMVPHLHWHIIPRYEDDAFYPGSTWARKVRETPSDLLQAREHLAREFETQLRDELTRLFC